MNKDINVKLDALREGLLTEASGAYSQHLMDADQAFLEAVAKKLKTALGTKLSKIAVKRGVGAVWLEGEGEDKGDIGVDFVLSLNLKDFANVVLNFGGNHAMNGKLDRDIPYKTGVLTPDAAAAVVLEKFQ